MPTRSASGTKTPGEISWPSLPTMRIRISNRVFLAAAGRTIDAPALALHHGLLVGRQADSGTIGCTSSTMRSCSMARRALRSNGLDLARDARIVLADVDLGLIAAALLACGRPIAHVPPRIRPAYG